MDKSNALIAIITVLLVVGILYITLSNRSSSKALLEGSGEENTNALRNPQDPQQALETTTAQNNLIGPTAPPPANTDNTNAQSGSVAKQYTSPPAMTIDTSKTYTVQLNTSEGIIKIELDSTNTPITANNFVFLSKESFYDGTVFHRVIDGFMIQGGDPNGNGTGGPGYKFSDESLTGNYTRGAVAMANSGSNTNGSQFFIMHKDYPLPNKYVIFGKVIEGIEVVDKIAEAPTTIGSSGEKSKPINPVTINSVEILDN